MDISKLIEWTEGDRIAWETTWNEPHMKKARLILALRSVPPKEVATVPGVDINQLQGHAYSECQGRVAMLAEIDTLLPVKSSKPLPPAFQDPNITRPQK